MKRNVLGSDTTFGLIMTVVFAILAYGVWGPVFQGLERWGYDLGVRASDKSPSDRVAVVAIDDASIANLGRWPWPRDLHAEMIKTLASGGAKGIGSTVLYSEAQQDAGLAYIDALVESFMQSSLVNTVPQEVATLQAEIDKLRATGANREAVSALQALTRDSALTNSLNQDIESVAVQFLQAQDALNTDAKLAAAFEAAGTVVQAMVFQLGQPQGRPDQPLPDYVQANALTHVVNGDVAPIPTLAGLPPIPVIGQSAAAIGHLSLTADVDGAQRYEPLVLEHFGAYYPSLPLMLAARALNLTPADIEVRLGEGIRLGGLEIDTTPDLRMYNYFYGAQNGAPPFPVDSFFDVLVGNIPPSKYRDKLVLIGASAAGIGDSIATPVSAQMAPVVSLAHTVSSILEEHFFVRPAWAVWAGLGAFLLAAAWLVVGLPRLGAGVSAVVTLVLALGLFVTEFVLMVTQSLWIPLLIPVVFLVLGHVAMTVKRLRVTERLKVASELEGAESNKMLGLAFQGQGQLDMAFDKFRKCPVDDGVLDVLYNLGLDYERKRSFGKAHAVYQYMAQHQPKFRDLQDKLKRAKQLEETVILGGGSSGGGATLITSGDDMEKPMLGRYEVVKELGKGAMGTVYLGKDPKIGRTVAIKTMALQQEFEEDELEDVKARFFREAETAGRLAHPNIVTIFDAGEEHDLAFIAMEFIKGYDLTKHTKSAQLLPVPDVIKLVADAADALDYAHNQNIVHRDIKPANLMWLPEERVVKVTDFGIARITDASKTKTGMVLGTPSYMSPEQLSGRKVDGRSDIFSLTVTLYQLLTGQLPFQADSMATLMYKIANDAHAPANSVRPELPPEVEAILEAGLQKEYEKRFARAAELSRALRGLAVDS
ncbi:CHASE2 domain-containing serine/threonine-protein kinase [Abyssibacter sp.]|uniref:CHASE2 domain-containing serine/threonine-protein kinase n=1 Tax=Abyssibacter sp. TaxID=2320200 RepID=UPI0035114AA7